jgi:hypothetical protein
MSELLNNAFRENTNVFVILDQQHARHVHLRTYALQFRRSKMVLHFVN